LEEAAHKAKTRPLFTRCYAQCAARRGRHIATTAVARKPLARAFQVLKEVEATSQPSETVTQPGALGLHAVPATRPKC
jgi:hypothetical protein